MFTFIHFFCHWLGISPEKPVKYGLAPLLGQEVLSINTPIQLPDGEVELRKYIFLKNLQQKLILSMLKQRTPNCRKTRCLENSSVEHPL